MNWQYILESFDSLSSHWKRLQRESPSSPIFSSFEWSKVWWQHFGFRNKLHLGAVRYRGGEIVGIAPLLVRNNVAFFIGSSNVCDYLDFIVKAGKVEAFFGILLDSLTRQGVVRLDLAPLRPDSTVLMTLVHIAQRHGWQLSYFKEDVSVELNLPATWEEYLLLLTTKQRRELRRKFRRLAELGKLNYQVTTDADPQYIDAFVELFRDSRPDKAAFLTPKMESFFRSLARTMAEQKLLRLGILELSNSPVTATMCFDYNNNVYLYHSGYDPEYGWLSVGLISKVLCIKDSIERGRKRFDFLKGGEAYKHHLGGHEVPLYRCTATFVT